VSFPTYQSYKEVPIPWIQSIPEHWEWKPVLGAARERDEDNKGMKEDNLLSLSYGKIVNKDINTSDGLLPESFETYQIVRPGDIVLRLTDLQNDKRSLRSALVTQTGIITSAYLALEAKTIDPKYLGYLLRAYDVSKVFYSMGGGLRQSMKYGDIKRMPLVIPTKAEQLVIATFLDRETAKIDALIAEQQRLIELLQEKRQAVISQSVTKGLNPEAPMKDSGVEWLGEVPEHWATSRLRHLGILQNGLNIGGEAFGSGYPFISYGDAYKNRYLPTEPPGLVESSSEDRRKYDIQRGDVLFTRTSETIDDIAIASTATARIPNAAFAGFLIRFRPKEGILTPEFSSFLFRNKSLQEHFSGTLNIVTRASLSQSDLGDLPVALPPIDEQVAIASRVTWVSNRLLDMLNASGDAVSLLQERRSALISAAVTGQIDVRGLVPEAVAA
jgi:type I restriction enzyme S subunit